MRRRNCCRFLGCISRHTRKADKVWPVRPVNGIHRVVDGCVQDCKAPRRMYCNRLRSRRPDDRKKCSIPLNDGVIDSPENENITFSLLKTGINRQGLWLMRTEHLAIGCRGLRLAGWERGLSTRPRTCLALFGLPAKGLNACFRSVLFLRGRLLANRASRE